MILDSVTVALVGGLVGGFILAILGWANRPDEEPFIPKKFIKSIVKAAVGGIIAVWLVLQAGTELTFWGAFFAALLSGPGLDVLTQEGWQISPWAKPKSTPAPTAG